MFSLLLAGLAKLHNTRSLGTGGCGGDRVEDVPRAGGEGRLPWPHHHPAPPLHRALLVQQAANWPCPELEPKYILDSGHTAQ